MEILNEIDKWVINPNSPEHLLWLHGPAGSGKSAIASSICDLLHRQTDGQQYLGASFFCKHNDKYVCDSMLVLPTIATDFADAFLAFAKAIAALLSNDRSFTKIDAMRPQFTGLIKEPLTQLAKCKWEPLVIVVNAVDEIGMVEDHRQLIPILYEMARLVSWLKIILTSQPDSDF